MNRTTNRDFSPDSQLGRKSKSVPSVRDDNRKVLLECATLRTKR